MSGMPAAANAALADAKPSGDNAFKIELARRIVVRATNRQHGNAARGLIEPLTQRELEVLQAVAQGLGNKDVADKLCVSINTIQVHLHNIFGKLGVASRTAAVSAALKQGLIKLKDD